jgi:hypothetical protein
MRAVALSLSLLSSLFLLGCTAQPIQPLQSFTDVNHVQLQNVSEVPIRQRPATGDRVVCVDVAPTGSHIPRRRCNTQRQRDQQAAEAQEWMLTGGERGSLTVADPMSR